MVSDPVLAVLKFGKRMHIDKFVQGEMYMNPLSYFAKLEEDELRGDSHEGEALRYQPDRATCYVTINGTPTPIPGINGPIVFTSNMNLDANAFCMHAMRLSRTKEKVLIDPRNFKFGDSYALLKLEYFEEFIRRVRVAAEKSQRGMKWDLVEYVNPATHNGDMGPLRKVRYFEYQSEFRVVMVPGTGSANRLCVGDLSDLIIVGPLAKVNQLIEVI